MNILIVDDNRHMRRMLVELVRSAYAEHSVFEAGDASSALAACLDAHPEFVLVDVGLPDANGIDLTATIKALLPETRILIVSSNGSRVYREAARAAGASAYITKDEIQEKLLSALTVAIAEHDGGTGRRGR